MVVQSVSNYNLNPNVIPTAPGSKRQSQPAFSSNEQTGDSLEPAQQKESFTYRNRGTFGFFGGAFLGQLASTKIFKSRLETAGTFKQFLYVMPGAIAIGMLGQILTEKLWNHDK